MFGNSVSNGFGVVILFTLAGLALSFAGMITLPNGIASIAAFAAAAIGLTQLLYVIPLYILWKDDKPASAKGLIIGASVVALLNASCWGAFFFISRR